MRIQSLDYPGATGPVNTEHFELRCIGRRERRDLEEDGQDEGSVAQPLARSLKQVELCLSVVFDIALLAARCFDATAILVLHSPVGLDLKLAKSPKIGRLSNSL